MEWLYSGDEQDAVSLADRLQPRLGLGLLGGRHGGGQLLGEQGQVQLTQVDHLGLDALDAGGLASHPLGDPGADPVGTDRTDDDGDLGHDALLSTKN